MLFLVQRPSTTSYFLHNPQAYQEDLIPVSVTVENQGTFPETTKVTLTDTTYSVDIGSVTIEELSAGATIVEQFLWDTSGALIREHTLLAVASQVQYEADSDDNFMNTITNINEQPVAINMYVSDISISLVKKGVNYQAIAYVTIKDDSDSIVKEANVTGDWTFNSGHLNTVTNITTAEGIVRLDSNKIKASSGDIFTITITSVAKDGYTYNPGNNIETSDSVTVQ